MLKTMKRAVLLGGLLVACTQVNAAPTSYSQSLNIPGPINYPSAFEITFTTPTGTALTDGSLLVTSQGDWSFAGDDFFSPEMMIVYADGNLIEDNLFQFDAGLDPGSPPKNDNFKPIFQTISIPIALLGSLISDGSVLVRFELTNQVDAADESSFTEADLSFRYDANGVPEPGTLALLGFGLAGLAASRRRKQ